MNLNANGGVVYEYGNEYIVRGVLSTNNVERLKKALIRKNNEMPIYLGDVAEIKINGKAPKLGCGPYVVTKLCY
jgi:Cu/Ag efflux pump CusA